ncbi:MAG TPA: hypothetical protein VEG30_18180 [Terriglobales bacterium]|nr:hypothetical protein [Terriglobales bacterium]
MNLLRRNPELLRHVRSELRAPRMALAAGLSYVLCFLISILHSQMTTAGPYSGRTPESNSVFFWILIPQALVLSLWCLSSTTQSIAGERLLKTYDFLRTTRLTAGELLVGMVFGVPIMAYFAVGCTVPFAIAAGLGSQVPLSAMLVTYFLLFVFVVFLSLVGLLVSMLVQKPRAGGALLIVWFWLMPFTLIGMTGRFGFPYPGVAALTIVPGLLPLYHAYTSVPSTAPFFGVHVPLLSLSLLLYVSLGAWIVVALLRNLKREREEIQLLSRWQAIGLAAYLNLLMLGFLDPAALLGTRSPYSFGVEPATIVHLAFNNLIFYAVGLATLTPPERLKIWFRDYHAGRQSYLSENGPPWPWMALAAALAFVALWLEAASARSAVPFDNWSLGHSGLSLMVFLVYATRDVLFLQWCTLTKMKNPIVKGILLVWLYYFAAGVITTPLAQASRSMASSGFCLLTPAGALVHGQIETALIGAGLQIGVIIYLLFLIRDRLTRAPAQLATA